MLFRLTREYKISVLFRRFFFFNIALLQMLFEGNVAYFIYVCFGNMNMSFSFSFADKLALVFTVLFLFVLLVFSVIFYLLLGKYLMKQAGYFIYCFYRCLPAHFFLALRTFFRGCLRGAIHYFLYHHYEWEIICLTLVELIVLICAIIIEKRS